MSHSCSTAKNVAWWGGDLYVIGDDGAVYRGDDYTASLSSIHLGNGQVLTPYGDLIYPATDDGTLHRLDPTDAHFETYLDPVGDLDIVYMTPFRSYLAVFGRDQDGTMRIYRVPDQNPTTWHEIARLPASGDLPEYGCPFAVHADKIYFSPGRVSTFGSYYDLEIWTWNGTVLEKVTTIENDPSASTAIGLLSWNGHVLYYSNNTKRASVDLTTNVTFYTLQLKIELDDDTAGGNEDIRINVLSVVYTEAER